MTTDKTAWIKRLIPRNSSGKIYAKVSRDMVVPARYKQYHSLGFRVDNHDLENEYWVTEVAVSFLTVIDGRTEWVSIPIRDIYYVEGGGTCQIFNEGYYNPDIILSEDTRLVVN